MKKIILSFLAVVFICPLSLQADECIDFNKPLDIVIIGAGISGLAAAQELRSNGKEVVVLEANNRIGGRIYSHNSWGSALDLGASWIHGVKENPIGDLARSLRLDTITTRYNHKCLNCQAFSLDLFDSAGKQVNRDAMYQLKQLAEKFIKELQVLSQNPVNQKLSVQEFMEQFEKKNTISNDLKDSFEHLVRLMIVFEEAAELSETSVLQMNTYSDKGAWGDDVILLNGYNQITNYLAKELHILLNEKVNKINRGKEGVAVSTTSGKVFKADYAIITVPLGVLKNKDITFEPALPQKKQTAIDELRMGVMNKIYLFFPCVFWDENAEWLSYIPKDYKASGMYYFLNHAKYVKQPILMAFTAGDFAKEVETWSDEKTVESIMAVLKKMYGEAIPSPSSHLITRWGKNPSFYGSYSFMGLNSPENIYDVMAEPIEDTLYFAGEAASKFESSTVYGAYLSGIDAAKQIIASTRLIDVQPLKER